MDTFKEKVQSMTAKEIIMAMVNGLKNPVTKIDMSSYGRTNDNTCFGCAATNAICEISGKPFTLDNIGSEETRSQFIQTDVYFICTFEAAINALRLSLIERYNDYASQIGVAQITQIGYLPILGTRYTNEQLEEYINLANAQ